MADLDRVIDDIERCINPEPGPGACWDCSKYHKGMPLPDCAQELLADALELLKEQGKSIEEQSVDIGYLHDWYQSSVTDDPPCWTDEHIEEVYHDFYLIPKGNIAKDCPE